MNADTTYPISPQAPAETSLSLEARFRSAQTFSEFLASAQTSADLWRAVTRRAAVPEALREPVRAVKGQWHLLVLVEDWCADAVNTVPYLQALADAAPAVDMRLLSRDDNPDLMDAHLSPRGGRAIPVVMVLDANFVERAWWGSRPGALQHWIDGEGAGLSKEARHVEARKWYTRDRGVSTISEVLSLLA